MKAICLPQPKATLVAIGAMPVGAWNWMTDHRGEIAIHASQYMDRAAFSNPLVVDALGAGGVEAVGDLPLGAIIAVGDLFEVLPASRFVLNAPLVSGPPAITLTEAQFLFAGFRAPGNYGYRFRDVIRLDTPIGCHGLPNVWKVPERIETKVRLQLLELGYEQLVRSIGEGS